MNERMDQKVTGYKELDEYPDYPAAEIPTKADCEGYKYMSMKQLCDIADGFKVFRKGKSFACAAFGGDKGEIPVQAVRQARVWLKGGNRVKKFVLVRAVEKFFEEEGLDWK